MPKVHSIEESSKALSILQNESFSSIEDQSREDQKKSKWSKFLDVIWDGQKTKDERKYFRKLDIFLLTWGWYVKIATMQGKKDLAHPY